MGTHGQRSAVHQLRLACACPQTASFFLTYVTLSALWTSPFSGLRLIGLLLYWIKSKIAATEKARARLWQEQTAKYGADVSI
jgi:Calcium-dependent channel, 7TM region, putative phosphate